MYVNGLKYACSTCIKGHRSSHCNHVDRPLLEIRKKGRPISQCTFCRELRKTKQVHIKCACNDKKGGNNLIHKNRATSLGEQSCSTAFINIPQDDPYPENNQCTCPSTLPTLSTDSNNFMDTQPYAYLANITPDSLLAPVCPTPPLSKDENLSDAWLASTVTPHLDKPSEIPSCYSIGLTKTSQRTLDDQPRIHKRKSIKRISSVHFNTQSLSAMIDTPHIPTDSFSENLYGPPYFATPVLNEHPVVPSQPTFPGDLSVLKNQELNDLFDHLVEQDAPFTCHNGIETCNHNIKSNVMLDHGVLDLVSCSLDTTSPNVVKVTPFVIKTEPDDQKPSCQDQYTNFMSDYCTRGGLVQSNPSNQD